MRSKRINWKKSMIMGIVVVLLLELSVFAMEIEKKPIREGKKNESIEVQKEKKPVETEKEKKPAEAAKEKKPETIPAMEQKNVSKTELGTVDATYFSDAIFIGDSRTEGFQLHAGLTEASYLTAKGLNVKDVFEKPLIKGSNGKQTIAQALKEKSYQKYYIMLGANELGWVYSDIFTDKYGQIIDLIREVNPNATVYVQSILPVTDEKSQSDAIYNNTNIVRFNELLKNLAEEKSAIYLNVSEAVQKEDGALQDEATTDGVHLNKEYCLKWLEYLKEHTNKE